MITSAKSQKRWAWSVFGSTPARTRDEDLRTKMEAGF